MNLEDIRRVGVVGAGTMGFGIALNFALGGYETIMADLTDQILSQASTRIKRTLDIFVDEGLVTQQQANNAIARVTTTTDLASMANSDFVTEAVVERVEDKRKLFSHLDAMCPSHTIIVSNTSSLLLNDFTSEVKRQDKLAITHYFVPPYLVPVVEVGKGPGTSQETLDITIGLMTKIKKVPIRVLKMLPGYVVNRIQGAMRREAYRLWAEGVASAEDIEQGIKSTFGFRCPYDGPMTIYDLSGVWRWPEDVRNALVESWLNSEEPFRLEAYRRIKQHVAEGKPWLIEPERLSDVSEKRDRECIRKLKEGHWIGPV
jgi:3-hydroxybutyryl-CoA dehydrogenase